MEPQKRAGDWKAVAAIVFYAAVIVMIAAIIINQLRGGSNGDDLPNTGITMEEIRMEKANLCPNDFDEWLGTVSALYGVDPEIVRAIIERESGGQPDAVNPETGAAGLMQIMPRTWDAQVSEMSNLYGIQAAEEMDPLNPHDNVRVGLWLLSTLITRYEPAIPYALDCYALGEGAAEDRLLSMDDYTPTEWTQDILARAQALSAARAAQLSNDFLPAEAETK